ncbi:MAG: sigma-70 family RNA polymerase sigma factor [bacterium]|nr:sigma-70 family RNA polymerase sigma factor [bacterium]
MEDDGLADLIDRAQRREPQAFDDLVERYGRRLFGYLYRLTGSRDDADDLLQEVFVRLVRTIGGYQHDGRFEGWLFRIATNLARDRVRRIRQAPAVLSLDVDQGQHDADRETSIATQLTDPLGPAPDTSLQQGEDADRLQQALGELPDAEREVILLRHFSGMSFAEVAEAMGTPLGTALARSHRGLGKLRALLEGAA